MHLTLKDYITSDTFTPSAVVTAYLDTAKKNNADYFSFVRFHEDYIQDHLDAFAMKPLKAAPIGIKDIILTEGYITSC